MKRFYRVLTALFAAALILCLLPSGLAAVAAGDAEAKYYGANIADFKLGYTGWGDKIAISAADKGGVTYTFKNAGTGVLAGYTRAVTMDGFHVRFSNFNVASGANHGRIGLIFGDTNVARWVDTTGSATMMIWLDIDTGKVTQHPGTNTLISSNDLKKENLGKNPIDFEISAPDASGNRTVTVNGHEGVLTKAMMNKCDAIKDLDTMYFSITGCAECTMSFDLVSIHDGTSPCLKNGGGDLQKVDAAIAAIDAIGTVTKNSAAKITAARKAYDALGNLKGLVSNFTVLEAAEAAYKILTLKPAVFDADNIAMTIAAFTDSHNNNRFGAYYEVLEDHTKKGFDIVLNAGDITDGTVYYNTTNEIPNIQKVFKNVIGDTPYLFCLGNHDSDDGSNTERFYKELGAWYYRNDLDKTAAEEEGNRHMKVGNYHFIALEGAYTTGNKSNGYSKNTLNWFRSTLESIVKDSSYKGEYIFLVTHQSVGNTVAGSENCPTKINEILKDYPQVVVLSGHSHWPIADERSIMQNGSNTFIHLGAQAHLDLPNQYVESVEPWLVENSYDLPSGCIIEIDKKGALRITRYDLLKDEQIKQPWIIPAPAADKSNLLYYTDARSDIGGAPAFPADTVPAVVIDGDDTRFFINAAKDDDMIFSYTIEVIKSNRTVKKLESLSGFYNYPDVTKMPAVHSTTFKNFGIEAPYTLKIRAKDVWGNLSDTVTLEVDVAIKNDYKKANAVIEMIDGLAGATAADAAKVKAARAAYAKLNASQKPLVENYAALIAAEETVAAGDTKKTTAKTTKTTKKTEAGDTPAETDTPADTEEPQSETEPETDVPETDAPTDTEEPQSETLPETEEPDTRPTGKKDVLPLGAVIGIAAGGVVLIAAIVVLILLVIKKKRAA